MGSATFPRIGWPTSRIRTSLSRITGIGVPAGTTRETDGEDALVAGAGISVCPQVKAQNEVIRKIVRKKRHIDISPPSLRENYTPRWPANENRSEEPSSGGPRKHHDHRRVRCESPAFCCTVKHTWRASPP